MLLKTKYLGEIEINEDLIMYFKSGLPGFPDDTTFVLLDIPGNDMIQIMQSVKQKELAFFVTNPYYFYPDYKLTLDELIVETLDIKNSKELVILSIMTIHEPFSKSTINLQAPVIINFKNKHGKQFILEKEQYSLKAPIPLPCEQKEERRC